MGSALPVVEQTIRNISFIDIVNACYRGFLLPIHTWQASHNTGLLRAPVLLRLSVFRNLSFNYPPCDLAEQRESGYVMLNIFGWELSVESVPFDLQE